MAFVLSSCCWWSRSRWAGSPCTNPRRSRQPEKKQEKVFTAVDAGQGRSGHDQVRKGRTHDRPEAGRQVADHRARAGRRGRRGDLRADDATSPRSRCSGSSTSRRPTTSSTVWIPRALEVTFKAGGQDRHLLIGQKTPTGTDLYARLADKPRVFLISSYLESTFNKSTFDLRDKTILKIDREKVDSVEIATPDRTRQVRQERVRLAHGGAGRRARRLRRGRRDHRPAEHRADEGDHGARTAADLKEYGLDKPPSRCASDLGQLAGRPGDRQERGRRGRLREGPLAADGLHRRIGARRRAEEARRRLPRSRISSTRARSTRRASRSPAAGRPRPTRNRSRQPRGPSLPRIPGSRSRPRQGRRRREGRGAADGADERASHVVRRQVDATGLETPEVAVTLKFDDGQSRRTSRSPAKGRRLRAARWRWRCREDRRVHARRHRQGARRAEVGR